MENQNSVAYIGRIIAIEPIPGADFIELAGVDGWHAVVKKGEYIVGQLVGVFTNEAVIPEELSAKLGIKEYLRDGKRVRTVRLKSVYSEAIVFNPMDIYGLGAFPCKEGNDLQDVLGVFKYEPPITFIHTEGGLSKREGNPNFSKYEKFPNAKNVSNLFSETDMVISTRKIHGTNFRAGIVKKTKLSVFDRIKKLFGNVWAGYEFVVGSHNTQRYETGVNVYAEVVKRYQIKEKLWEYVKVRLNPKDIGSGIIIYGEVYGEGIQGEYYSYGVQGRALSVFDIQVNGEYKSWFSCSTIAGILGLETVEVLYGGLYSEAEIAKTVGGFIEGTKIPNEGAVVKTVLGRRKVAKFINNDYLTFAEKKSVPDSH